MALEQLYKKRFSQNMLRRRNAIWKVLCASFFQKYISATYAVLDVGAGYCEFINNIKCAKKYAVDCNNDILKYADHDVCAFHGYSTNLHFLPDNSIDMVFMSNILEHLKTKEEVLETLSETSRVLKQSGGLMILQPNIRYAYREYWDFFDHCIPLSDRSLIEALQVVGFKIERTLPRFLPYTTKNKIPHYAFLVQMYLWLPLAWKILGKQLFILARKNVQSH
jgi:ubiquinone/menaquinone biosynthesis C-methylase UbiE